MKLTRTLGAALGLIAVLLFFASLTIQQGRVSTVVTSVSPMAQR
jgi:hypothetical protein